MEYTGSVIFDDYPDKLQLRIMCSRICENVKTGENVCWGRADVKRSAEVLLYQEIYRRRGEQRKRKQKFTVIVHCQENL